MLEALAGNPYRRSYAVSGVRMLDSTLYTQPLAGPSVAHVSHNQELYSVLTVREMLLASASLHIDGTVERNLAVKDVMDLFGLEEHAGK